MLKPIVAPISDPLTTSSIVEVGTPLSDERRTTKVADTLNSFDGNSDRSSNALLSANAAASGILRWGSAGNDYLQGTYGNDSLFGSGGDDYLEGSQGDDFMSGGVGNDTLWGLWDADALWGGMGNDVLDGAWGSDSLYGDAGDDTLSGGWDIDYLSGGDGNDVLDAFGGGTVYGGAGNDTLYGRGAYLSGGTGNDKYGDFWGSDISIIQDIGDTIVDFADATDITDTVRTFINYTLGDNLGRLELQGSRNMIGNGNGYGNTVVGNPAANRLNGQAGHDSLYGGAGNDTLLGGQGNDVLIGDLGDDRFLYSTGVAGTPFNSGVIGGNLLTDFSRVAGNTDKIVLSRITFRAGTSFANVGSDALAQTSTAFITFSTSTGRLFYNQNGASAGLGTGGNFATLSDINGNPITSNNPLFTTDFVLI
jgi:Ca2+-binding RTX toxin-like protein